MMLGIGNNGSNSIYRKMGYISDQKGILRRYHREKEWWNPHLKNTREAILNFASQNRGRKIAILGSGWLLDVPIEELRDLYSEIWLFDIRHPKEVINSANRSNIYFKETDISGFALPVYKLCKQFKNVTQEHIEDLKPEMEYSFHDFDGVISCNILDQLDDLLVDYLRNRAIIKEDDVMRFRFKVQNQHLTLLPKGKSLLITDLKEIKTTNGIVLNERDLLRVSLDPDKIVNRWKWGFDNHRSYYPNCNTWYEVIVVEV